MKFRSVFALALLALLFACADASACFRLFGRRANAVTFVPATPAPMAVPAPMPAKPAPTTPTPAVEPKKATTAVPTGPVVVTGNRSTVVQFAPAVGANCANGTCAPATVVVPARRGLFGWR